MAVKVTELPEHNGLADAAIERLTGRMGFTVMVTVFEVAGLPAVQDALDVITHEIVLPFEGVYV